MARKVYEVAFQIGANMAPSFSKAMSGAGGALGELNKQMSAMGQQQKANQRVLDLRSSLAATSREFTEAQQKAAQLSAEISRSDKPTKAMRREYEKAEQAVNKAREKMQQQAATLREVSKEAGATGKSTAQLVAEQKRLAESGERAAKAQAELQKNVAAQQANLQKRAEYRGQLFGAAAMAASVAAPVKVAMDFEAAMSKVGAVSRATDEEMAKLTATARELGASTVWSASQAAEGMTYLAMAGFSTEDIIGTMPGMLDLASAAGLDLGATADIASNMLSGFRLETSEMARVADVLVNTFTSSNTTLDGLGETMKYVAPIASEAGVAFEEVAAMAGLLGDNAIQGGQAGTALRAVLNRLAGPPTEAAKALAALGIETKDVEGNLRSLPEILGEVHRATMDLGSAEKLEYFKAIAGQEAGSAFAILVNEAGAGNLQKFAQDVADVGSAQRVAAEMTNNTRGSWVQFQSVVESVSITFGNMLLPGVTAAFQVLAGLLSKVEGLMQAFPLTSKVIVGAVTALVALRVATIAGGYALTFLRGAVLQVRGMLLAARTAWLLYTGAMTASTATSRAAIVISKALTAAQWLFNAALTANPIGLIIAAIAGLVAAGVMLYKNWDTVVAFFANAWQRIKDFFGSFAPLQWVKEKLDQLWRWLSGFSLFEMGKNLLSTLANGIKAAVSAPVEAVKGALSKVRDFLPFSDAKVGPLSELTYSGMQVMETLTSGIMKAATDPAGAVEGALSRISGGLSGFAERLMGSSGADAGGGLSVTINQDITVNGGGPDAYEQAKRGASAGASDLIRELNRALAQEGRLGYA